jgi:hypothetical protein
VHVLTSRNLSQSATPKLGKTIPWHKMPENARPGKASFMSAVRAAVAASHEDPAAAASPTRPHTQQYQLALANPYRDELKDKAQCIYFLRNPSFGSGRLRAPAAQRTAFLEHVACGEIVGGAMAAEVMGTWMSEVFAPILGSAEISRWTGWGACSSEDRVELLSSLQALTNKFDKVAQEARKAVEMAEPDRKKLAAGA